MTPFVALREALFTSLNQERERGDCSHGTAECLALKHESRILGHSSNPVFGFSMMEQVRLCAVWHIENLLGSSLNYIQGWMTVIGCYSRSPHIGWLLWRPTDGYKTILVRPCIAIMLGYKAILLTWPIFIVQTRWSLSGKHCSLIVSHVFGFSWKEGMIGSWQTCVATVIFVIILTQEIPF